MPSTVEQLRAALPRLLRRARGAADEVDLFAPQASPDWGETPRLSARAWEDLFDRVPAGTVGLEEELILVSPDTLDVEAGNETLLARLGADARFRPELLASMIEIATPPRPTVAALRQELAAARRLLVERAKGDFRLVAAGTHPFTRRAHETTALERYRRIEDEYVWAARRSLVCGLHVHVAVGGGARSLAVFNALRSYLPEIVALTANSPFFQGEDTGLCTIRPKLNQALPRTGVPPALPSWASYAAFLDWGRTGGLFPDGTFVWWDLRPHPVHGTLELRVADSQTLVQDAIALAALVQCLCRWLGDRHDAGEPLPVHATARIAENAWRAQRYGLAGHLVDLDTGLREPARGRVARLLDGLGETARALGCEPELAEARALLAGNGADRQRYVAEREDLVGLVAWLAAETERPDRHELGPAVPGSRGSAAGA